MYVYIYELSPALALIFTVLCFFIDTYSFSPTFISSLHTRIMLPPFCLNSPETRRKILNFWHAHLYFVRQWNYDKFSPHTCILFFFCRRQEYKFSCPWATDGQREIMTMLFCLHSIKSWENNSNLLLAPSVGTFLFSSICAVRHVSHFLLR